MRFPWFGGGLLVLFGTAGAFSAVEPTFRFERSVTPGAPGPNRLAVDAPLLSGAKALRGKLDAGGDSVVEGGLEDLRLFDATGREVPYLLMMPETRKPEWRRGTLAPIPPTKSESGFEVDLGTVVAADRIRTDGLRAPFLKRFRLEGSGDRTRWITLVADGTIFDLPEESLRLTEAGFGAARLRFLRVVWDDRATSPVPLPASVAARLVGSGPPPASVAIPIGVTRRETEPRKSRFALRLPGSHLPVRAVVLETATGNLLRTASIREARLGGARFEPVVLGSRTLRRTERDGVSARDLRIPVVPPNGPDLDLVVDDGDNPPLELVSASAELAPLPWIYFESPDGAPLVARYGAALEAPRYDLEAIRSAVPGTIAADAAWSSAPLSPLPPDGTSFVPPAGAPIDVSKFARSRGIHRGPAGLVALLLDADVLATSPSLADVRLVDSRGRQVPYVLERREEPLVVDLPGIRKLSDRREPGLSRYVVPLPQPGLPPSRLVLTTTARLFDRSVRLVAVEPRLDSRSAPTERTVSEGRWVHAVPEIPPPPFVLDLPSLGTGEAVLVVDEGDNPPLPLGPSRLLLPAWRLRFLRPSPTEPLTLHYGQAGLGEPRYDLALLAARISEEAATEIRLVPRASTTSHREKQAPAPGSQLFWGALVAAVVVLVVLLVRLLRSTG